MALKCPKCHHENPDDTIYCGKCTTPLKSPENISVTKTLLTPVEDLKPGTLFAGRYEIIRELGKGGMGKVYKALDTEIHEQVAIKLLKPEIAADEKIIERFRNELKIARKITHKNVCRTFHIGKADGTPYITMEFVPGEDLKSLIQKKAKLAEKEALDIAKQVCSGLAEAHELGVVHRDLKPQNIMIDEKGRAKIMDFGIARSVEAPGVTEAGMIIGTPDYISPEQAEGEAADHRSDIYSLGVILYEMVTGDVPFKGETALSIALKHKSHLPLDPRKLSPEISESLSRLILICMEKDRERRYQSAESLLNDLQNIEEGLPLGTKLRPRRVTLLQTLIRKKLLIPALAVIIAIIAVGVWRLRPPGKATMAPMIENSIAVINFENLTGNPEYDRFQKVIPSLMITDLESQASLYVPTFDRMQDILKQLGKEEADFIDLDLGLEICRKGGIQFIVQGTFSKAGNTFVSDIRVLDVKTKRNLNSRRTKGIGEDSLINQIDELSQAVKDGIGFSQPEAQDSEIKIADLSTPSLKAYDHYLYGQEAYRKVDYDEAIAQYKIAVEFDPQFAAAWLQLATSYHQKEFLSGAQVAEEKKEAFENAKKYSGRVSEKERLLIEAAYARRIEKNGKKQIMLYEQLITKYPREKDVLLELGRYYLDTGDEEKGLFMMNRALELDPFFGEVHNWLGIHYLGKGDFGKALEHQKKHVALRPNEPNPLDSLAHVNFMLGRADESLANFEAALAIDPDFDQSMQCLPYLFAFKEDYGEAAKRTDQFMDVHPTLGNRWAGHLWKGFFCAWTGRFQAANEYLKLSRQYGESVGSPALPPYYRLMNDYNQAQIYREGGQADLSGKLNEIWYPAFVEKYPTTRSLRKAHHFWLKVLLDVQNGRMESAKASLVEGKALLNKLPEGSRDYCVYFSNVAEGEIMLSEGRFDEAISLFQSEKFIVRPSIGDPTESIAHHFPFTRDQLARAYQQKGDLEKAIQEYERLTSPDRTKLYYRLIHPLYYYRMALLFEQTGQKAKAIKNHERFLDLWKDADPGRAEVEDARKRLDDLKAS
jgi:serine/threonine protein kinase/tetratricopeptide (TPR) repeat protein